MFKKIKLAQALNRKDFSHIQGRRFRYSPQTTWLTLIIYFLLFAASVYFIFDDPHSKLLLSWVGTLFLYAFFAILLLHKIIQEAPVFIVDQRKVFYTKTEKWYDPAKLETYLRMSRGYSVYPLMCMSDLGQNRQHEESLWFIEHDDELKALLKLQYQRNAPYDTLNPFQKMNDPFDNL